MLRYFFVLLITSSLGAGAQPADSLLRVGIVEAPPYCIKDDNGNWTGMAVALWRQVAEDNRLRYEYVELNRPDSLIAQLTQGNIDLAVRAPLLPGGEDEIDYLQAYYRTSIGMALPVERSLFAAVKGLFSLQFLYIVLGLSVLLLFVGAIVYFLERNSNGDQFGGERTVWQGLGSGFWWAGVTMTTIGYGDKAPQTVAGRAVAMLWMLLALAVTSSLTAAVISATQGTPMVEFPNDLDSMEVGTVTESPAAHFLEAQGIDFTGYTSAREGMRGVKERELDVFIHDATALRYITEQSRGLSLEVKSTDAEVEGYAFAVREDSPLYDPLSRSVIAFTLTTTWQGILREYGGARAQVQNSN